LSALQQCFQCHWQLSPNAAHHNFIFAIQLALSQSPVQWQWQHIHGHEDKNKDALDLSLMECLNIQMDANAKHWWDHVSQATHQPTSTIIPGEGWSIFHQKLATFNRQVFDLHAQYQYSQQYWEQPNKLGMLYHSIDWIVCGNAWKKFPLAQQLWSTKWLTNWLPTGKNMF